MKYLTNDNKHLFLKTVIHMKGDAFASNNSKSKAIK